MPNWPTCFWKNSLQRVLFLFRLHSTVLQSAIAFVICIYIFWQLLCHWCCKNKSYALNIQRNSDCASLLDGIGLSLETKSKQFKINSQSNAYLRRAKQVMSFIFSVTLIMYTTCELYYYSKKLAIEQTALFLAISHFQGDMLHWQSEFRFLYTYTNGFFGFLKIYYQILDILVFGGSISTTKCYC